MLAHDHREASRVRGSFWKGRRWCYAAIRVGEVVANRKMKPMVLVCGLICGCHCHPQQLARAVQNGQGSAGMIVREQHRR